MADNPADFERDRAKLLNDLTAQLDTLNRRDSVIRAKGLVTPEWAAAVKSTREALEMAQELAKHIDGYDGLRDVIKIIEDVHNYQKAIMAPWPPPPSTN